jgi:hypothetical protein
MTESIRWDMILGDVSPGGFQIASRWARPVAFRLPESPKPVPEWKDCPQAAGLPLFDLAVRE